MCSFGSCQARFEFLSQFRKVRNAFECFVTQVQTRLPKTKCVWPMKINVICTVFMTSHKITFYSKFYDVDFLEMCTITDITQYMYEFWLSLHQHHVILDKKDPRTIFKG